MLRIVIWAMALLSISPALADAWTIAAKIGSGSGTISFGTQVVKSGTGYLNVPNGTTAAVTVAPADGYAVSMVVLDGSQLPPATTYTVSSPLNKTRNLIAYFTPVTWSVTLAQSSGGIVSAQLVSPSIGAITQSRLDNIANGSTVKIVASPNLDYLLTGISVGGASVWTGSRDLPMEYLLTVNSSSTVSASFTRILTATARLQTASTRTAVNKEVQLDASTSTTNDPPLSYSFAVTSGDPGKVSFTSTGPSSPKTGFVAQAPGSYVVTVTATSAHGATSTATSATIDVLDAGTYGSQLCISCHGGRDPGIVSLYLASDHATATGGPTCASCHNPTYTGHFTDVQPVNSCSGCHLDASGEVPRHPFAMGENICVDCHNPHAPKGSASATASHFNNLTGAGYPASYVTSRSECTDCHYSSTQNALVRGEWATSGHAATRDNPFVEFDFKTMTGCVQCHTTTGFVAYSTGKVKAAWGIASDKTKEVITCKACHSDVTVGAVRSVTPAQPFADDTYRNRDVGKSNICFDCHSGTNNGASIATAAQTSNLANLPFIPPHYLSAGGSLHAKSGYHFAGQSYAFYSTNTHHEIGMGNKAGTGTSGPCVACHMSAQQKHLFAATGTDQSGALTAISAPVCANCHGTSLAVPQLAADQATFANALTALKAMLAYKGFVYSDNYPYFKNTEWGTGDAGANTMGAAFNYVLFRREPGAYAHNTQYARKVILDSIDYLDDGRVNDSVATLALPTLLDAGLITKEVADSVGAYRTKEVCADCHGGSAASATPMATSGHPAHLTADYGPGAYLGTDSAACQACHRTDPDSHLNGRVDVLNGAGSACQGCHAGSAPSWTLSGRLDCGACHAASAAKLPNGVAAPYKGNFTGTGHGKYAVSNSCTVCHDPDSRHISGSLGSYTRLRLIDDNNLCAACHNDATLVRSAYRNMTTHVTKDGRSLYCRDCHDPHGSGNLSMVRTPINGSAIVFTNADQAVDLVNNRGLCQVCHTQTNHYRAGVPETVHFTTGCLNCHTHNTAGGAFRPSGYCDTCHGYPPAPKKGTVAFGVQGSWSAARFEDYTGGGGTHLTAGHVVKTAKVSDGWTPCLPCHSGGPAKHTMAVPVATHQQNVDVILGSQYGLNGTPTYGGTAKPYSCSNLYCHSDGTSVATGLGNGGTPVWGSTLGCTGCHAYPPAYATGSPKANSHASHNFGCNSCHAATTTDGVTIADGSKHANRVYDVVAGAGASFTYTYAPNGGTCSNISCHNYNSATWGTTLTCTDCHATSPGGD